MNYKQFKRLNKDAADKFMFDQLNERFYTPIGFRVLNTFILIQLWFLTCVLAMFNLLTYDNGKFKDLLGGILPTLQVLRVTIFLFVGILILELANIIYKAYQEHKLIKKVKVKTK